MLDKVVFIDRDGTMGGNYDVEFPQDYYHYDTTREAIALLKNHGFFVIIITNQSCIARKKDGGYDFAAEFAGIGADDWFICPHDSADDCLCRKPKAGLLLMAQEKYDIDMQKAYMIGDRWSDMAAGGRAGARLILVMTGRGAEAMGAERKKWAEYQPCFVADDLMAAAGFICGR